MIEEWSEFNVAMAGATAALVGLVIVASSVNIGEIIKSRTLTARLLAGIAALVLALAVSAISLVPGIDRFWFGVVTIFVTVLAAIFQVHATRLIATDPDPADRARPLKYLVGFLPLFAYLAMRRAGPGPDTPRGCTSPRSAACWRSSPRSWCHGSRWSKCCAEPELAQGTADPATARA